MKKGKSISQSPLDAAYQLGLDHNASDVARKLGISPVVLGNKLNPHQEFHKLSLGEAVAITDITGDDRILEAWARSRNFALVKIPGAVSCDEELSDQLMKLNEVLGSALGEIRQARQDGVIDPVEFNKIKDKLVLLITESLALENVLQDQVRELRSV